MIEFDLAQVITAIGGVIGALGGIYALWTKYNQDAKNKKTEYELENALDVDFAAINVFVQGVKVID